MIPCVRKEKILTLLNNKELVTLDEIKENINDTSVPTLRRDLKN